jgi:hypothetical protein
MAIKYVYQHLPSQDRPKFTQIGIFGLKINHLATQFQTTIPFSPDHRKLPTQMEPLASCVFQG